MTITELDEKIARSEERLKALRLECTQLVQDIDAAKAFRAAYPRIMGISIVEPLRSPAHIDAAPLFPQSSSIPDLIRDAIAKCGTDYTIYDIERIIAESGAKVTRLKISQTLSDWSRKGKVFVKKKGAGNGAATYTKTPPVMPAAQSAA